MVDVLVGVVRTLLRAVVMLLGLLLATGLVVFGLLLAAVFLLVAKLRGRPVTWQAMKTRAGVRGRPPQAGPVGEVIDIEAREVVDPVRRLPEER